MKIKFLSFLFVLAIILGSCKKEFKTEVEFNQWINDTENGLKRVQNSGGLTFIVKYLPPVYLAKKEIKNANATEEEIIKITNSYKNSLSFLLIIKPDSIDNEVDLMKSGLKNYEEYKQRFLSMNFELGENIKLKVGDKILNPSLFNVENTYGANKDLNINIVFDNKEVQKIASEKIDLIFTDDYFETGIHHFVFHTEKIAALPELNY